MKLSQQSTPFSLALTLALLLYTFFTRLAALPIRVWDEARNANNALHMHLHGNWMVPYYNGAPDMWNTKPPLLIWLQALSMRVFGINEWAVRWPAAAAAVLTGLLLWAFVKKYLGNGWTGFTAAAVLCTSFAYVDNHAGRTGDYDALLVFFTTAYALALFCWVEEGRPACLRLFFLFLSLAVLTKGIAGWMQVPGAAIFLLACGKLPVLLRKRSFYFGCFFVLLVVGGYYGLREYLNPGYLRAVYENELGGRFLRTLENHRHPFSYYLDAMRDHAYSFWCFPALLSFTAPLLLPAPHTGRITLFNALMVVPFLLAISAGQTKLEWYALPIYPFLAIQLALWLYGCLWRLSRAFPALGRPAAIILLFAALFYIPFRTVAQQLFHFREKRWDVEEHKLGYYLQWAIRSGKNMDGHVVAYSGYNGHIAFYVQKLQLAGHDIALESGIDSLQPGAYVVLSESSLQEALGKKFSVQEAGEKYGCRVYLVQSR